ncbi:MAG TPA: hypothetical protein ENG33_06835 [Chloroflexi bacterium]|nr:hypothetical protein [Chloroflexota bacterium]
MAAVPEEQQWNTILRILEKQPDLKERLRRTLFSEEFLSLPEALRVVENQLRRLAEAQQRTQEQLDALMEMQRRNEAEWAEFRRASEERLTKLEETVQSLVEAQEKSEERLTRLEETVQSLVETQKNFEERLIRLEETVQDLIEAQKRTEVQMGYLIKAQERTEKTLNKVVEILAEHSKAIGDLKGEILEMKYRSHPTYFCALVQLSELKVWGLLDGGRVLPPD